MMRHPASPARQRELRDGEEKDEGGCEETGRAVLFARIKRGLRTQGEGWTMQQGSGWTIGWRLRDRVIVDVGWGTPADHAGVEKGWEITEVGAPTMIICPLACGLQL